MSNETLFELHKNLTPSTCAVDPVTFLRRIREYEATLPEGSARRMAWAAITTAECQDGIIRYTTSDAKVGRTRAIGETEEEVIANALATPAYTNMSISVTQIEKLAPVSRIPCEFRRQLFGIFEMFPFENFYVINGISITGITNYINLLSTKALGYSSPMRAFACKVLIYSDTEFDITPKASFLAKLQAGMESREFLETLALGMYNHHGELRYPNRADKLNQWCPGMVPSLALTRASINNDDVVIVLKMMTSIIGESVNEVLLNSPLFQQMSQAGKNAFAAEVIAQALSKCVPTMVMIRAARREFGTVQEYVEARDAEHTSSYPEEHAHEYELLQECLAGSE